MSEPKQMVSGPRPCIFPFYTRHTTDIGLRVKIRPRSSGKLEIDVVDAESGAQVFRGEGKALKADERGLLLFSWRSTRPPRSLVLSLRPVRSSRRPSVHDSRGD